ncbi:MAG: DUF3298/DUF4163 domain-containing protein [Firmicutes bacterium HGW-Firmicutes-1]|jgi:hypothetical protein|nr:MAG: DUF3298/DUF4163 domain-containing protein [Firmicutes bacterium HGW-Firmicutes-1]
MQRPTNKNADVYNRDIHKTFTYNSIDMLTIDISYPQIRLNQNLTAQKHMNTYYQQQVNQFYEYASIDLRQAALESYQYRLMNNFPFLKYEAVMKYTVTLNANCLLSTYFDQYEFTGGAHGNTVRSSSNWTLKDGYIISMKDLFHNHQDYKQLIINQIRSLADQQIQQNPTIYFSTYQELIIQNFNPENFYLIPDGIAVYYQQYEIGPYASGIIVFDIPYQKLGITSPGCLP